MCLLVLAPPYRAYFLFVCVHREGGLGEQLGLGGVGGDGDERLAEVVEEVADLREEGAGRETGGGEGERERERER